MKTTLLIVLLLVTSSYCKQFEGKFMSHNRAEVSQKENFEDQDLSSLLKHNFGVLENPASERALRLIEKLGKGNLMNPLQMNYMFIVEGLSQESSAKISIEDSLDFSIELSENKKNSLIESIFGQGSKASVVELVDKYHETYNYPPFHMYSSDNVQSKYFRKFGMALNTKEDEQLEILDFGNSLAWKLPENINQCLVQVFDQDFSLEGNRIISSNGSVKITEQNSANMKSFFKDVCSVYELTLMFQKGEQPNLVVFQIDSLSSLEKQLTTEEFDIVLRIFSQLVEKSSDVFEQNFGESTFGQIMYIDENLEKGHETSLDLVNERNRIIKDPVASRRRVLEESLGEYVPEDNWTPASYSMVCWTSLVLVFVAYWVFYQSFCMSLQRDTILYAKFSTNDKTQ